VDVATAFLARAWDESGPFARASASLRKDLIPNTLHQGSVSGGVGWQLGANPRHVAGEYNLELVEVGGSLYVLSHRLNAAARWTQGRFGVGALYAMRWLSYRAAGLESYSGVRLEPQIEARVRVGAHTFRTSLRYTRALADAAIYQHHVVGLDGSAIFELAPFRVLFEPSYEARLYDGFDADLGVLRRDHALGLLAAVEWDLGLHWTWQLSGTFRHTLSNAPITSTRWTAWTGLSYTLGVF
jgi:hypothetical protein